MIKQLETCHCLWAAVLLQLSAGALILLLFPSDGPFHQGGKLLMQVSLMEIAPAFVWSVVREERVLEAWGLAWLLPAEHLHCLCCGCRRKRSKRRPLYISNWSWPLLATGVELAAAEGDAGAPAIEKPTDPEEEQPLTKVDNTWWKIWWVQFGGITVWAVWTLWQFSDDNISNRLAALPQLRSILNRKANSEKFEHTIFALVYLHVVLSFMSLLSHVSMALAKSRLPQGVKLYGRDVRVGLGFIGVQALLSTWDSRYEQCEPVLVRIIRAATVMCAVPSYVITTHLMMNELSQLRRGLEKELREATSLKDVATRLEKAADEHAKVTLAWQWFVHWQCWLELLAASVRAVVLIIFGWKRLMYHWAEKKRCDLIMFVTSLPTLQPLFLVLFFAIVPHNDEIRRNAATKFEEEIRHRVEHLSFFVFGIRFSTAWLCSLGVFAFITGSKVVIEALMH